MDLLRGYVQGKDDSSGKKFYCRTVTGSANRVTLTRFGKYITKFFEKFGRVISYTPSNSYGAFFLSFGALSLVLQLVLGYLGVFESPPLYILISTVLTALFAVPFLLTDKPLALALQDFSLTDYVFFEFFCIRRMHKNHTERGIHFIISAILGALLAALSLFVPFVWLLAGVGVAVYVFLTFMSPEFSFFSIFLAMPYLSFDKKGIFLAAMVLITLISYARKVTSGKRVYFFEQYDLVLLLMLTCILISGIFVKGVESFVSSVVMILLGMGYILSSGLVSNRRLADCLINAVIISSLPVSVIAIVEAVLAIGEGGIQSFGGAAATFDEPYTLAIFLLVSITFALYFVSARRSSAGKALYFVIFLITLLALFFTMNFWAFATALIGALIFGVLKLRHGSGFIVFLLAIAPYLLIFLNNDYLTLFADNFAARAFGLSDSVRGWMLSLEMVKDNILIGVGIGEECFAEEMVHYHPDYMLKNSGNFLLEVVCEAGIFSLVAFIMIFAIRVNHRAIYRPYVKNSQVSKLSDFTAVTVVIFLIFGMFNYVWDDMTMYYLFWCVFGLGSAVLRVSKQEFDDRVAYFSDGSAEDSSSIDISIR